MVIWTQTAKENLKKLYQHIAEDSHYYAQKVKQDIFKAAEYLEKFPNKGRKVPEVNRSEIREILIYSYRIVYRTDKAVLYILRILHTRQKRRIHYFYQK